MASHRNTGVVQPLVADGYQQVVGGVGEEGDVP